MNIDRSESIYCPLWVVFVRKLTAEEVLHKHRKRVVYYAAMHLPHQIQLKKKDRVHNSE